jgi:hypothetical protein
MHGSMNIKFISEVYLAKVIQDKMTKLRWTKKYLNCGKVQPFGNDTQNNDCMHGGINSILNDRIYLRSFGPLLSVSAFNI